MTNVFTNGRITLTKDLVFGVCVLTEEGFVPLTHLSRQDMSVVRRLLDFNPTCPPDIFDAVYGLEVLEPAKEELHAHVQ
jgi:hypothetical protein